MRPTVGLFPANTHALADPDAAAEIAQLAERLGYDSLWTADHVVLPRPRADPSPMEPDEPLLDPLVALAHLAAHTERVALATGCIVLPQRNPLVLAKQAASVDVLSHGRLVLGVAVGYLEPELDAVGIPMAGRGARTDEYLAAMRSLWYDDRPSADGTYVRFAGVDAHPRPVQRPIPVVVGGHSAAAHRRAATLGDGWYGFLLGLRAAAVQIEALRAAEKTAQRAVPLEVSVTSPRHLDPAVVAGYAELGVDRLVVAAPAGLDLRQLRDFVVQNSPDRLGARRAELDAAGSR